MGRIKMEDHNKIITIVLYLSYIVVTSANDCKTLHRGSCVSSLYSHCLQGEYYTRTGCDVDEICCFPGSAPNLQPALRPDQCGMSTPIAVTNRIVGGTAAVPGEFPWQVSMRNFGEHSCGGILIDKNWILTAAHCFQHNHSPVAWSIVVGESDRALIEGQEKIMKVDTIFVHSHFDPNNYVDDIAMVQLVEDVTINAYVRPACIPDKTQNFINQTCVITGWGASYSGGHGTRALFKASVPVLEQPVCSYLLSRNIPDTMICAGYKQGGVDSCQGDSGGPMVCQNDGIYSVAGIVSWGYSCAEQYTPGVYTNVPKYVDWIHSVLNAYDRQSPILFGKRTLPDDVIMFK